MIFLKQCHETFSVTECNIVYKLYCIISIEGSNVPRIKNEIRIIEIEDIGTYFGFGVFKSSQNVKGFKRF